MNKVATIISNFNMPERTDALVEHISDHEIPCQIVVVDNGSKMVPPSKYTTVSLPDNVQTTGGWLAGLDQAKGADYYWIMITSAEFLGPEVLRPMVDFMDAHPEAVGAHPALSLDSTAWAHLLTQGGDEPREVKFIDNIAALWRASWFDSIGQFDPSLRYAWGSDLETCHVARTQGQTMWVMEPAGMKKVTDIGYTMGRMGMTAERRRELARRNMESVLSRKYGPDWHDRMYGWQNES